MQSKLSSKWLTRKDDLELECWDCWCASPCLVLCNAGGQTRALCMGGRHSASCIPSPGLMFYYSIKEPATMNQGAHCLQSLRTKGPVSGIALCLKKPKTNFVCSNTSKYLSLWMPYGNSTLTKCLETRLFSLKFCFQNNRKCKLNLRISVCQGKQRINPLE